MPSRPVRSAKRDTNPFFVKMREGAQQEAAAKGARLLSGAGKADGDNAGQVTHMENMVTAGAKTILITPNDSKAIVPSIRKARAAGIHHGRVVHAARGQQQHDRQRSRPHLNAPSATIARNAAS